MTSLLQVAADLQAFLVEKQWQFCFIGGIALQPWGQPRLTVDVDVSLLTGVGREDEYVDALCERYRGRIDDARVFALQNRVLLLESADRTPIDIALAGFHYEEEVIGRARNHAFTESITLRICSAEDLIVLKAFAERTRDWADVESVVDRQGRRLDRDYILDRLDGLSVLKEAPQIMERVRSLLGTGQ